MELLGVITSKEVLLIILEMVRMADQQNVLDDLWEGWDNKTLEQKQHAIKSAVARMPKVLFSGTDRKNLLLKSLEVGKALNLHSEPAIVTPSKKWLQDHDPNYYRRQKAFADAQATGRRVDPEFDPWSRHSGK